MVLFYFVLAVCFSAIAADEEVRLLDLAPNEAQGILDKQDLSLKYAPKIESNVPGLRFLGNERHEVLEDIYLAKQFHGQDGIGGYVYGYSVPDIAKSEKKVAGGDLKGSYSYINGDGQEIKVEYWDDGTGFHQTDNLPKVELKQVDFSPEVKAAREEHFRIWKELAAANGNPVENYPDDLYKNIQPDENQDKYNDYDPKNEPKYDKEEVQEPIKDPRGFFYSFDYPVGIITEKGKAVPGVQKRDAALDLLEKNRAILNGQ